MRAFVFVIPLAAAMAPTAVRADPAYDSRAVIEHFAPRLGKARGICVGTPEECAEVSAPVEPFDLLVTFEFNSDRLTGDARSNLDQFAAALRDERLAAMNFVVEGHTDATGSAAYNLALSERRARAVVDYLVALGLPESRFVTLGRGKTAPRVADPYAPENRRVETRPAGE